MNFTDPEFRAALEESRRRRAYTDAEFRASLEASRRQVEAPAPAVPAAPAVPPVIIPERPRSTIKPLRPPEAQAPDGDGGDGEVDVDIELARLAIALKLANEFRAWLACRRADKPGRGILADAAAFVAAQTGLTGARQAKRILATGAGLFWKVDKRGRVRLTGWKHLAGRLFELAGAQDARLVATNRPGGARVKVELAGGLQLFEARVFTAWLVAARDGRRTISRALAARLFGVNRFTTLRWQKLAGGVNVTTNYAYSDGTGGVPAHAFLAVSVSGVMAGWQMANTYTGESRRARRGQSRKVRMHLRTLAGAFEPAEKGTGGRKYFFPRLTKAGLIDAHMAVRKSKKVHGFAYAQVHRRGHLALFEHTDGLHRVDVVHRRRDVERLACFKAGAASQGLAHA